MKRIIPILIMIGIAAGAVSNPYLMVIARKNAGAGATPLSLDATSCSDSTTSFTHSQGALSSGFAVVIVSGTRFAAFAPTAVTYDGNGMTLEDSETTDNDTSIWVYSYAIGSSASGSKTVAITWDSTPSFARSTCVTFDGADQAQDPLTGTGYNAFSSAPSASVSGTTSGSFIVGACLRAFGGATVTPADTEICEYESDRAYGASRSAGDGGAVSLDWTLGTAGAWSAIAIEVVE